MTFHNVQFLQKVNHQGQKHLLPKNILFTLKTECEKTNFIIIEPLFKQGGGGWGGGDATRIKHNKFKTFSGLNSIY